mmetsp:Transcript_13666/g.47209  ORF Transcript_13666/g.47209 Transcript_13666/m.47209 type:complete len:297 (+) Transcript_13666:190-1080(+)
MRFPLAYLVKRRQAEREATARENLHRHHVRHWTGLDADKQASIRAVFSLYDKDKSGTISAKELGDMLRVCGQNPTEETIRDLMIQFDSDGSGSLDIYEFAQVLRDLEKESGALDTLLMRAFKFLDSKEDGSLDLQELCTVLMEIGEPLSEAEVTEFMKLADSNGDGVLSVKEFLEFFKESVFKDDKGTYTAHGKPGPGQVYDTEGRGVFKQAKPDKVAPEPLEGTPGVPDLPAVPGRIGLKLDRTVSQMGRDALAAASGVVTDAPGPELQGEDWGRQSPPGTVPREEDAPAAEGGP